MSSDLDALFRRDDPRHGDDEVAAITATPAERLNAKLDAIAAGGNGDPPHDPETGEILSKEENDFVESALAGVKAEAAAAGADASSQGHTGIKENGPALNMQNDPTGEEAARQLAAKLAESHSGGATSGVADPKLAPLLEKARAMATNGLAKFNRWEGGLSAPDYTRIGPHLEALREAAAAADGGGA